MEGLQRLEKDFHKPFPGSLTLAIGAPGSGKSTFVANLLSGLGSAIIAHPEQRPRLLFLSSGGAAHLPYDQAVKSKFFDSVREGPDLLSRMGVGELEKMVDNHASSVVILDDLVVLAAGELAKLVKLLYTKMRHRKMTVICCIHAATHLPGIESLIRLAHLISLHPCASNLSTACRLKKIFGWDKRALLDLCQQVQTLMIDRQRGRFDAILYSVPHMTAVMNVLGKPLGAKKSRTTLNLALQMSCGEMDGWFYLVPKNQLREVAKKGGETGSEREKFLTLFGRTSDKERVKTVLHNLANTKEVAVDYEGRHLTCGGDVCNLVDFCMAIGTRRRRRMLPQTVRAMILALKERGIPIKEVRGFK